MNISGLLPLIQMQPAYCDLVRSLEKQRQSRNVVVLEEAKAPLLAALAQQQNAPVLVLTARPSRATLLVEQLQTWLGDDQQVWQFPEPDVLPYERLSPDPRVMHDRLRALNAISRYAMDAAPPPLIVAPLGGLVTPTLDAKIFAQSVVSYGVGERAKWEEVTAQWLRMGYQRVTTVEQPGQYARRGGVIDCFPPHLDMPFRLDLFGDEIESIRLFEPGTQRSTKLLETVTVIPTQEVLPALSAESLLTLHLDNCNGETRARISDDLARLAQGNEVSDLWFYSTIFNHTSLLEYLPANAVVVVDERLELSQTWRELQQGAAELRTNLHTKGDLPANYPEALLSWPDIEAACGKMTHLEIQRWGGERDESLAFAPAPGYAGRLRALFSDIRSRVAARERVVLVSLQTQRLSELLEQEGIIATPVESLAATPSPGSLTLLQGALPGGWSLILGSADDGVEKTSLTLFTDAELFGFVKEARRRLARREARRENPLEGIAPGDYVVHIEHGIGRFRGTVVMADESATKEYLFIEYGGGGKLYVPADQVDRVARYVGPGGYAPALSSLGTQEWDRAKERVRKAAVNIAKELLETTAARQVLPGISFSPDTVWQQELEASFPYVETPDQLIAVHDVKDDMEAPRPMDRIICGDVGYGKTEVALRAAFKAVQDGMQVAVLVPTTVLAQQHYQTFTQRLSAFPINVEVLSRFRSEREQQQVVAELRSGKVDIVIGTHRIVQKDVAFKNLGLVIVDEEQRFGVVHKEHFKQLRREVDVLSLSATPIPRTLYMALVGVRDMSAMETPPEERHPIKTYVMEHSEDLIRQAIVRELERGGQVFFVHNRVQTIAQVAHELQNLVPEARIAVGHGQMPEELLEQVMLDFAAGKHDVLLCTTIIESGLDLPNVNTIIINNADKLGLAQLYQLRGRVGRGMQRAYAYLLYTRNKALTEPAQKRLQAVFEATELGAGYFIAMKDLEIRGAGNLLGVEQSGHIGAVGFDLYCRILASAVEDAKAEAAGKPAPSSIPQTPSVSVELQMPAYLPEDYVPDMENRLDIYRRLAAAQDQEGVDDVDEELRDRFGPAPGPVDNLLFAVRAKVLATRAGVASMGREGENIVIRLLDGLRVDASRLQRLQGVAVGVTQVRVDATGRAERWQPRLMDVLTRLAA